jgi:hypothetical protein
MYLVFNLTGVSKSNMKYKLSLKTAAYATVASLAYQGTALAADYTMSVGVSSYDYGLRIKAETLADLSFDGEQYEVSLQRMAEDYTLSIKHSFSDPVDIAEPAENSGSPVGETLYMSQEETSISLQKPINETFSWFAGYYRSQLDGQGHDDGDDGDLYNEVHHWLKTDGVFAGVSAQRPVSDKLVLFGRAAYQMVSASIHLDFGEQINDNAQIQQALGATAYGVEGSASLLSLGLAYPLKSGGTLVLSYDAKDFDFDDFYLRNTKGSVDYDWNTIGLSINFAL